MAATRGARPPARVICWPGLACYLLFLAVSPLLHHDLECHLKTPSHCGACMASPPGLSTGSGASLEAHQLPDAGKVSTVRATVPELALAVDAPGRAPPA
jgi:hypothetical protein